MSQDRKNVFVCLSRFNWVVFSFDVLTKNNLFKFYVDLHGKLAAESNVSSDSTNAVPTFLRLLRISLFFLSFLFSFSVWTKTEKKIKNWMKNIEMVV